MGRARTWLLSLAGFALAHVAGPAAAGIATDGTVGPRVTLDGNFEIDADLGRRAGGNLFHSFERFSLGTVERATFSGPAEIRNVISRVTGGARSDIDGTIASTIPGADFYFINPAGVMFGPNAILGVQGSFHVSTATELRFADGAIFSATSPAGNSFTHAPPEAFGFLDRSAGSITLDRASLPVFAGESVTLVGGDVVIDHGRIDLPPRLRPGNGTVTLVAMSRPGAVRIADGGTSAAPDGDIRITGEGATPRDETARHGVDVSSSFGGVVRIRAGHFEIEGAEIRADNTGDAPGETMIDIQAERVRLSAGADIRSIAREAGDAGDVTVRAGELEVLRGSLLRSDTLGAGDAGAVSVLGARRVLISREGSGERTDLSSSVGGRARGSAGSVTVQSEEIMVRDSGAIVSVSSGAGDSGQVAVTADRVAVLAGGQIGSGTLRQSTGRGGDVTVTAREEVVISGQGQLNRTGTGREPSGIFTSTESRSAGAGPAGRVFVEAPVIRLADRGEIASESMNPDEGGTNPADSGSVAVWFVDLLEVDNAEVTTKAEISNAGDITIKGRGVIDVRNGGQISTTVFEQGSEGNAGDITIDPRFIILDDGRIQANGRRGQGGNIDITVDNLIQSPHSVIEALSELGIDGTVVISTPEVDLSGGLVVLEGALLDAASQLRERCGARRDVAASSFTGVGRGGLPPGPDGPLAGSYHGREAAAGSPPPRAADAPPDRAGASDRAWAFAALAPPCAVRPATVP